MSGHFAQVRHGLVASLLLLTMVAAASAQSITDPVHIEFTPSAVPIDALDVRAGTPMVVKYTLDIFLAGSSTLVQTVDLGNPLPDPDGMIRVDFVSRLSPPLARGVIYEAVVNGVGSVETVSSVRSATFMFSAACTPGISPASSNLSSSAAATGTVAVTAASTCAWTASSNASWITITANAIGTGNATLSYAVAANTGTTSRTGTISIGGQTFTVTQAGATACTFAISPTASNLTSSAATTGTVGVTSGTNCSWTATSNASWITISSGASGSGNGSVGYSVAANTGTASRTGTITVGGQTFTVTQAGATPCTFAISPAASNLTTSAAATGTVGVTSGTNCSWTATSNASWITISNGASGSGNGTVAYSVAANAATTSRTGTMTIGGQTFTVTQAGAPCTFTISPTTANFSSSGGAGTVGITAGTGCSWTATSSGSWLTISNGASGSGNGVVTYSVAANTNSTPRSATITVAGQTFTVTQAAASCVSAISPQSSTLTASIGASGNIAVTAPAGCNWTAASNDSWITVTVGATGTGNGNVAYNVAANPGSASRTGSLTIGGTAFTVTQPGAPCAFTIAPFLVTLTSPDAAAGTVTVSTGSDCAWTAASNASWITVTSGASGTGNGPVNYTVAPNTGTTSRTGTITIAGKTFSVTQPATSCAFTISPTSQAFPVGGGTGSVTLTTSAGCNWTASSNAAWVTITSSTTGTGSSTISFNVIANPGTLSRSATLTIGGKAFTVTEAGSSCTYSLTPSLITAPATGTSGSITVTTQAGCSWTATTTSAWITVSGSGAGSGTATYAVQPNTGTIARSGLVNVGGVFVGVSQAAPTAAPTPDPN